MAYGYPLQKSEIISEIILKDDETNDSLLAMVKDKFGNYVVQKMIEVAESNIKELIIKRIISSQSLKKRDGFCKILYIFFNSRLNSKTCCEFHRENGLFSKFIEIINLIQIYKYYKCVFFQLYTILSIDLIYFYRYLNLVKLIYLQIFINNKVL